MNNRFCLGLASLLTLAQPGAGNAQDLGAAISESAPVAFFRALGSKVTGNPPAPAAIEQQQVEQVDAASLERGPARADEVLSSRSQARMSKRDAFGAPETPTICTNCAD
jgi:hypothetical protein